MRFNALIKNILMNNFYRHILYSYKIKTDFAVNIDN